MSKHLMILTGREEDEADLLGRRVRLARQRRGLTQAEVADRAGLARATVGALESGRPGISLAGLLAILSVLGLQGKIADALAHDELGEEIEMSSRQRVKAPRLVADF